MITRHSRRPAAALAGLASMLTLAAGWVLAQQGSPGQGGFGPPPGGFVVRPPGLVEASPAGLLRLPAVQDELELADDERDEVRFITRMLDDALVAAMREVDLPTIMDLSDDEQSERIKSWQKTATKASADADEALVKLLTQEQAKRLKQIVLQRAGAQAFARLGVIDALDLTADQQAKLKKLLPRGAANPAAFGPPVPRVEVTADMLAVLTDAQRTNWNELLGEAFDFAEPTPFPFGPGGPGGGRGGPGFGPGGPNAPDREILAQFDANKDGWLNRDERAEAREWLSRNPSPGRGGPFGGGGFEGGRGGRGRGPGGPGGRNEPGSPGAHVAIADVPPLESTDLYDQSLVRTLFLEFENEDWETELETFHGTDVDVPATLTVDGRAYKNVGIRFRGMSSYMGVAEGSKRSLNLSLDLADPAQRLYGSKTLNLLNAHGDPTFMHTVLYARIARDYVPTPKASFVRLVINGESWGLYTNAQQYDKIFIAEHFPQDKNALHTARWKVSGSPQASGGLEYFGEDETPYRARFEIKSDDNPQSWQALIKLCRTLNETPPEKLEEAIAPLLDIESTLWFLALDNALINCDGYWIRASDYALYLDGQGKFHIIPHDMNEAMQPPMGPGAGGGGRGGRGGFGGPGFGGPPGFGGGGRRGGAASYDLDPLVGLDDASKPLRSKLLAVPNLQAKYLDHVREIAEAQLDWNKLGPIVAAYAALIRPEVEADTRKLTSLDEFDESAADVEEDDAPVNRHNLAAFAKKRRAYLLKATAEVAASGDVTKD